MNWSKFKKILTCMMIILVVSAMIGNVYADINSTYYDANKGAFKVADTKENLILKVIASVLLDAIGSLVYALANLGEWLLGLIFQAASGGDEANNIFPWADAIVFNAIPFLDVNFINPYQAAGKTFETSGTVVGLIRDVIKSVYGTVFGLSISFFSIAVLIMGIKLAVSTIASEKAKYKQAIWDWLLGLVLLFTIHFFISFVFYLNEQLVNEASTIATTNLNNDEAKKIINIDYSSADNKELVTVFIASQYDITINNGLIEVFEVAVGNLSGERKTQSDFLLDEENIYITANLLKNSKYRDNALGGWWANGNKDAFWTIREGDPDRIDFVIDTVKLLKQWKANNYTEEKINEMIQNQFNAIDTGETDWDFLTHLGTLPGETRGIGGKASTGVLGTVYFSDKDKTKEVCTSLKETYLLVNKGQSSTSLIANLAQYFKEVAWTTGENSWKTDKVVIQNALMYAILVVQSFIFLIAYIKRLFYVVILAMMAPAVVVYDFFNKSIS